jgi:hypothetical protein
VAQIDGEPLIDGELLIDGKQPSEHLGRRSLSRGGRRRLATGLLALALAPLLALPACGNEQKKQLNDPLPEPRPSTDGVRSQFPQPVQVSPTQGPVVAPLPKQNGDTHGGG